MLEKVKRTIEAYRMLRPGDRVVVAVSGGVDSMVLLWVLYALRKELKLWLAAAHLDHRMRAGSEEDARFVADYAKSLKLPLVQESCDVPAYVRAKKLSLEEGARWVRYRFLAKVAKELNANVIALGHNLDDRVETFFINLLRGSGLEGLAGMPAVRTENHVKYIRPLIDCSRKEIEQFAHAQGLSFREDPTNRDRKYLRNRVRWELLPILRQCNPNILETVARAQEALHKAHEHFKQLAESALQQALICQSSGEIVLDAQQVLSQEELVRKYLVREAIRQVKGDLQDIEAVHIESVLAEMAKNRSGACITLPEGILFIHQGDQVRLTQDSLRKPTESYCFELHIGAENSLDEIGWRFDLSVLEGSHPISEDHLEARLDYATIAEPLYVRNRRRGDCFEPLGLGGTKKLQDLFVDAKIPREERDRIPIVCDQAGILWVVGWRLSERGRVTPKTRRTLRIRAVPLKE